MNTHILKERILLYLYNELTPDKKEAFEAELAQNPELRRLLEEERKFHQYYPTLIGPLVLEDLETESRLLLRHALRREDRKPLSLLSRLAGMLNTLLPQIAYTAGAVATLLLGIFLGQTLLAPKGSPPEQTGIAATWLTDPDRFELLDLSISSFDPETGKIMLSVNATSNIIFEDNIKNEAVQDLFAVAMRGNLESATRLETVELLQYQTASKKTRDILTYALLNDANPGVRLKAVETLKGLADDDRVRQALLAALVDDQNPGIRVEALDAVKNYQDNVTIQTLKSKATNDNNTYIRSEAFRAVQQQHELLLD